MNKKKYTPKVEATSVESFQKALDDFEKLPKEIKSEVEKIDTSWGSNRYYMRSFRDKVLVDSSMSRIEYAECSHMVEGKKDPSYVGCVVYSELGVFDYKNISKKHSVVVVK